MASKYDTSGYPDLRPYPASKAAHAAVRAELSRLAVEAGEASGVTLTSYSGGEFLVKSTDKTNPHAPECGKYGAALAEILNEAQPRCGAIQYGRNAIMTPGSGWCWVIAGDLIRALQKREM